LPRAIWKGSISFGLVNIPVSLYPAEQARELSFTMLDKRDLSPVGYKRINKRTGEDVPWDQIVKGHEYERGTYVVLTDQDLKRANVEATQTVDIVDFVEAEGISPLFYERPYYLEPTARGRKAYVLLRETLRRTGKVGIARVVIRTRQHVAAVLEREGVLVLELLRYAHEIREVKDLDIPDATFAEANLSERELQMAERLVSGMVEDWTPDKYKDTYVDDLMAFIEKKVRAGQTAVVDETEPAAAAEKGGEVVDLMPLLKRSLEKAEERPRREAVAKAARRGGGGSRARGRSKQTNP
jgi:DNA end-binding protein Ku